MARNDCTCIVEVAPGQGDMVKVNIIVPDPTCPVHES